MNITVVFALSERQQVIQLDVQETCTAREAVRLAVSAGLELTLRPDVAAGADHAIDADTAALGVFGQRVEDDTLLKEGDRVEIYRPLQQDPMELRRQRAASEAGRLTTRRN